MDVISLGKALKAKKAIRELNNRLGEGVEDIHPNLKVRLEELEKKDPGLILNKRVSELETNTHINLNKHNLRVVSLSNLQKYKMNNLVFDDFADATGIDATKSFRHVFDSVGRRLKIAEGETQAEVVMTAEATEEIPTMIAVSQASNENQNKLSTFDLSTGSKTDTETVSGEVKLKSTDGGVTYPLSGIYISPVLDLGDNFKEIMSIEQMVVHRASQYTEDITPTMTSNTMPAPFVVSASSYLNPYLPWKAFDKKGLATDNSWLMTMSASNSWIQMDFGAIQRIGKYSIVASDYTPAARPKDWTFEGSNDGTNFVILDTRVNVTNWIIGEEKSYALNQVADFRYYRIKVTGNNGFVYLAIGEIKMMKPLSETVTDINVSTSSNGVTFSAYKPFTMEAISGFRSARYLKLKAEMVAAVKDISTVIPITQVDEKLENVNSNYIFKEVDVLEKAVENIQNWSTAQYDSQIKISGKNEVILVSLLQEPEPKSERREIHISSWKSMDANLKINNKTEITFNSNVIY